MTRQSSVAWRACREPDPPRGPLAANTDRSLQAEIAGEGGRRAAGRAAGEDAGSFSRIGKPLMLASRVRVDPRRFPALAMQ